MPELASFQILLISDDPETASLLREMLSGADAEISTCASLLPALDHLAEGGTHAVMLDLDGSNHAGIEIVTLLRLHAAAVPVIILSRRDNEAFALRCLEMGAQDYLIRSRLDPEGLLRSVRCAVVRHKGCELTGVSQPTMGRSRLAGCLGMKGGVGTTTIACLAALELKRQTGKRVLLADVNLNGGIVGYLTKTATNYSLLDAARDILRLDLNFWEQVVSEGPEELEVLPLPAPICVPEPISVERAHCVLRFLRSVYPWTVLDLGQLNAFSAGLLPAMTDLLVVTGLDAAAVFQTRQTVQRLWELGIERSRVTLAVNRGSEDGRSRGLGAAEALGHSELRDSTGRKRGSAG